LINLRGDDRIASVARVYVEPTTEEVNNETDIQNEDIAENEENNLE
jgi:hypothetical protein